MEWRLEDARRGGKGGERRPAAVSAPLGGERGNLNKGPKDDFLRVMIGRHRCLNHDPVLSDESPLPGDCLIDQLIQL